MSLFCFGCSNKTLNNENITPLRILWAEWAPSDYLQDLYGITVWSSAAHDRITMGADALIWAYGGDLGSMRTKEVRGYIDSPEAIAGLQMYKKLYLTGTPKWDGAYLNTNDFFVQGKVSMIFIYFAFMPDLLDLTYNKYAEDTGFFALPAGPAGQYTSLGGQGLSLLRYSQKKESSLLFMKWFVREDVQLKWLKLGGYSCSKKALNSQDFWNLKPYNVPLRESLEVMKDFWNNPEYEELLKVSQINFYKYVVEDEISAKIAVRNIRNGWENIFRSGTYSSDNFIFNDLYIGLSVFSRLTQKN